MRRKDETESRSSVDDLQLLTREDVANMLTVCIRTVDTLIRMGSLKAVKPTGGRAVRLIKSDVDDFIRGCRVEVKIT